MADTKISAMTSGVPAQDGDLIAAAREISPGVYGNVSLTAASVAARAAGVPSDFQPAIVAGNYYSAPGGISGGVLDGFQDVLVSTPFWTSRDVSWAEFGVLVDTANAGAKIRVGIYANGANNLPGALIADLGEIDCSSSGYAGITATAAMTANTVYWLAAVANDSTVAIFTANNDNAPWVLGYPDADQAFNGAVNDARAFTYGPLPDPFGACDDFRSPPAFLLRTGV